VSRSAAVRVNVIKPVLALCGREKELPEVSHISLTHRARLGRARRRPEGGNSLGTLRLVCRSVPVRVEQCQRDVPQ